MKNKIKGINKNILMIVLIPILVALGVVIGGYISTASNEANTAPKIEKSAEESTVSLNEFVLNLEPMGNINRYIKLEIALSTVEKNGVKDIEENMNKIRDVVIHKVSKETVEEIFEDEDKNFVLKRELKDEINEALGNEIIHQVYISNIVIQ